MRQQWQLLPWEWVGNSHFPAKSGCCPQSTETMFRLRRFFCCLCALERLKLLHVLSKTQKLNKGKDFQCKLKLHFRFKSIFTMVSCPPGVFKLEFSPLFSATGAGRKVINIYDFRVLCAFLHEIIGFVKKQEIDPYEIIKNSCPDGSCAEAHCWRDLTPSGKQAFIKCLC